MCAVFSKITPSLIPLPEKSFSIGAGVKFCPYLYRNARFNYISCTLYQILSTNAILLLGTKMSRSYSRCRKKVIILFLSHYNVLKIIDNKGAVFEVLYDLRSLMSFKVTAFMKSIDAFWLELFITRYHSIVVS